MAAILIFIRVLPYLENLNRIPYKFKRFEFYEKFEHFSRDFENLTLRYFFMVIQLLVSSISTPGIHNRKKRLVVDLFTHKNFYQGKKEP